MTLLFYLHEYSLHEAQRHERPVAISEGQCRADDDVSIQCRQHKRLPPETIAEAAEDHTPDHHTGKIQGRSQVHKVPVLTN